MGSDASVEADTRPPTPQRTGTIPAPSSPRTGPLSWNRDTSGHETVKRSGKPEPRLRQLMGVCGWAAVLGGIGLVIGLRGHIGILTGTPPTWYEPSIITVGLIGIALTVGAFLTVRQRRIPWILLGSSSVALVVALSLTSTAF